MAKEAILEIDNSHGIVAFVFGALSILFSPSIFLMFFYGPIISFALGVLGIIFALKQRKVNDTKWAKTGLILSIAGVALSLLLSLLVIKVVAPKLTEYAQQQMDAIRATTA
ncbi:MAG: DUF1240 domain-containing protein [archaeon]|nr:DUF1240 domain-containing protein [archaeon]